MNVSMPIAAVMLDLGFDSAVVKAVPILARTAGLLAHLAEEQQHPLGFLMASRAEEAIVYEPPTVDDARPRRRDAAVVGPARARRRELSPAAGVSVRALALLSGQAVGGRLRRRRGGRWPDYISRLPLTDKHELRAASSAENPFGTHLCASQPEIVRIYSTSGTTGLPSYIPLTASDLHNWITGSARSYAASGATSGQRMVTSYNAGPFVAGAALGSLIASGCA